MRDVNIEMAETEELKQMVLSFRRAELVDLLGFVGMNKVGVKATLLQRAVSLVNSSRGCSVPVQIKIRELYRQIHNPYASEPPRSRTMTRTQQQQPVQDPRSRRYVCGNNKPVSGGHGLGSSMASQSLSGAVDYSKRSSDMTNGASAIPVHPDVMFKRLPFYDIMGELLKPTSLAPKSSSRYQETYFVFHLTPQQAQDIAMSRDFRPSAKCEYTVQVQLRFCFLETSCEQDDNFPPSICVRVNGKMAQLPNPIPTTKPGVEPKRPGRPVDITSLCRISPTMPNHIEISWASEYGRGYCLCINLVKRLTSDILLQRLKQFGNRHADHTRALIKEKLQHDPDSEIVTSSLKITLGCPLGKMRMQLPCRAGTCTHLQCFDATTFLMMNEKKATWMCPVCDKQAPFHKLIIDGLFVEILRKAKDIDEIQFSEDGSWSPIRNNKETHVINTSINPERNLSHSASGDTVNLCGDSSTSSSPAKKPKMDVIDLTLSDSEDDDDDDTDGGGGRPDSNLNLSSSGSSSPALIVPQSLSPSPSPVRVPPVLPTPPPPSSNLPPMPPLLNYSGSSRSNSSPSKSGSGLGIGSGTSSSSLFPYSASGGSEGRMSTASSSSSSSSSSWLTALSGQPHGQKRPPPAHSGNSQPPMKRSLIEKPSDSPTSSNSNMSPLVDLDQLCSLLDSDRDRNNEEINVLASFPSDFPLSGTSSTQNFRNTFNVSPSDIISLD